MTPGHVRGRKEEEVTLTYGEARTESQKQLDAVVLERVERGIALLREKYGRDWADKIDMESFQITDGTCCVLGQVYGDYETGCKTLGIDTEDAKYGFVIEDTDDFDGNIHAYLHAQHERWDTLQEVWEDVLGRHGAK